MSPTPSPCPLCLDAGGLLVHQTPQWRLIRVLDDANFPAFYRLVWQAHVAEFSALSKAERSACMEAVATVERVLLAQLRPAKINLASLGNMVPHLHWHVIARFDWDSHFPNPVWGAAQREVAGGAQARLALPLETLDRLLSEALVA
ncbi:diadenosine tetraphosphate (Ap4A) HIT family hydrolase [Paucibacter oligotrophus]|uniref:Diadenosine tetraphosphate (Ap4A) HIT family hydrolase n=1 Tax=Roseateles oligotrophus TaxID=1769250 RepID=A0A840LJG6_9BURK|nr:HIT family protein [Roseateles oligotrophus]MBB4846129.1 diadenosine tetraphosphate (Ap4A) HIT family hydrolase [Roseateles oligotrophus]